MLGIQTSRFGSLGVALLLLLALAAFDLSSSQSVGVEGLKEPALSSEEQILSNPSPELSTDEAVKGRRSPELAEEDKV